ncbi:hypothetical protein CK934_04335 [Chitinophaga sp. MD30]|nr:hypothetical protein CK934_04335 [Chitinophaga sp. MD30]
MFSTAKAQVFLRADGPGNTYELIESVLGSNTAGEVPDCAHPSFGRHITEAFDSQLGKNVFIFHIHVTPDNDRCGGNIDRQRNEIKAHGPSPESVKGRNGETMTYRWKFKIDAGFIPTGSFCHIHQIKAGDGDDGAPLITLTPRAGNPQKLQVIHSTGSGGTGGEVASANLSGFKGVWVDVVEKIKYGVNGTYSVVIKRVSDGATLLSYSNNNINMWRDGTTFCRPKWGIYRKLTPEIRDEQVRFADFCIAKGSTPCPDDNIPSNQPPTASITAPANNAIFNAPASISITANASDADGSISKVEFFNGDNKLGEATASPYQYAWNNVAAGTYTLTVVATDNKGAATTSTAVNVTVNGGGGSNISLSAIQDAYVRSGSYAATNHGSTDASQLVTKLNPTSPSDNERQTYLTFDAGSARGVTNATLRLYGAVADNRSSNINVAVYPVSNTSWTESTINWNNKPATGSAALSQVTVTDNTSRYYSWDVTDYVKSEIAAGRTKVSFALRSLEATDPVIKWNADEAGSNKPALVLTTGSTALPLKSAGTGKEQDEIQLNSFPNPFTGPAAVQFRTVRSGHVRLALLDGRGQVVQELLNEYLQPGQHTVQMNGSGLANGAYILQLTNNGKGKTKMIIKQ